MATDYLTDNLSIDGHQKPVQSVILTPLVFRYPATVIQNILRFLRVRLSMRCENSDE